MDTPLVSISCITYNHAPFIRQCLDGFLMQQCNFPIEIIINDDCSTDGTTEIIREYAEKYPDKIFPIFHEENLYSQGVRGMFQKFVFPKARGKYIALCEGDDYWTDPFKLQKQVDFLESHPDYSMCFHKAETMSQDLRIPRDLFDHLEEREYITDEIIVRCSVPTASAIFRREIVEAIPHSNKFAVSDIVIFVTCSLRGRIYCMSTAMSVYRRHAGGWTAQNTLSVYEQLIPHWREMKVQFGKSIHKPVNYVLQSMFFYCLRQYMHDGAYFKALKIAGIAIMECKMDFIRYYANTSNNKFMKFISRLIQCSGNRNIES